MSGGKSIFTRTVHGIRLKYAAVAVVFLILTLLLFHIGSPREFGWFDLTAIIVLVLMLLALFLMQCHLVISPIERMTGILETLSAKTLDGAEPLRVKWNGRDEFSCLAAAMNGLLEMIQSRSVGLIEENRRLKAIVSMAEVELVMMNLSGSVVNLVHCPEKMTPVPGIAHGSEPDAEVWGAANIKVFRQAFAKAVETRESQAQLLSFPQAGGRARWVQAFIHCRPASSFPLVVFRDEQPAESKAFVPGESAVPLARIAGGIAHGLESGTLEVDDLAILGRLRQLRLVPVAAAAPIVGAQVELARRIEAAGVKIDYEIADGLPRIIADSRQLIRAVSNIVRNSVEAFGLVPGVVKIAIRPYRLTMDETMSFDPPLLAGYGVLISISDNGPGIPEDILPHVLESFCSTKSDGRGFGLAVVRAIIAAHGGGVRVVSSKECGTNVEIFLYAANRPEEDIDFIRKEFPGGEVLVVDDSKSILRITTALLRTQKIAAHLAGNREDALQKFSELAHRIRAVFLDAQLGETMTVALLKNMRDINSSVPIVVMSGYTRKQIDEVFAEVPPDAFLMKPYTIAELQKVLAVLPNRP